MSAGSSAFAGLVLPSGMPGANNSGSNVGTPALAGAPNTASVGAPPPYPSGQSTFPGNYNPYAATSGAPSGPSFGTVGKGNQDYPKGFEPSIAAFLNSGAGYNQQAINALIAQMQPQIERGAQNVQEQFAASGLRESSAAQIGLGDYYSQTNLDIGSLLSNMYQQAIQNYIAIITGNNKSGQSGQGFGSSLMSSLGSGLGGAISGLIGL